MATTKIWKIQKRLDHVIDYATNEEKTQATRKKRWQQITNPLPTPIILLANHLT